MSDLIDRAEAARRFPKNTCGASRHAEQIGVALVRDEPYPMLDEEPAYCGESILSVVASLWEARTEIERLRAERDALLNALDTMLIGACAVGVPHAGERQVLQECVDAARAVIAAARKEQA